MSVPKKKACSLVCIGRFAFFILLALQVYSLASYPAKYKDNDGFYCLTILFLPAVSLRLYIMIKDKHLQWLFVVWLLYVVGLVILIGIIFGGTEPCETIEDKFSTNTENNCSKINSTYQSRNAWQEFFGPNVLKLTLCLTPILLLLLLSTGVESMQYRELMWLLSLRIALDLFDAVEMLEIILEENELSHKVPREFEQAIIAFACITFLLSPMQLMEIKIVKIDLRYDDWKLRKCTSALRTTIQILCVNGVFLGLRLALFFGYGKDASIFIAKNGIIIFLSFFEICSLFGWCGCEDEE